MALEDMTMEELHEKKELHEKEFELYNKKMKKYPLDRQGSEEYRNLVSHAKISKLKTVNYQTEIQKRNLGKQLEDLGASEE